LGFTPGGGLKVDPLAVRKHGPSGQVKAHLWFPKYCLTIAIGAPPQDAASNLDSTYLLPHSLM
jgi:hypothetical protein